MRLAAEFLRLCLELFLQNLDDLFEFVIHTCHRNALKQREYAG
jgi:hypothetical protein